MVFLYDFQFQCLFRILSSILETARIESTSNWDDKPIWRSANFHSAGVVDRRQISSEEFNYLDGIMSFCYQFFTTTSTTCCVAAFVL